MHESMLCLIAKPHPGADQRLEVNFIGSSLGFDPPGYESPETGFDSMQVTAILDSEVLGTLFCRKFFELRILNSRGI